MISAVVDSSANLAVRRVSQWPDRSSRCAIAGPTTRPVIAWTSRRYHNKRRPWLNRAIPISTTVAPITETSTRLTTLMLSRCQRLNKRLIENRMSRRPSARATSHEIVARDLLGSAFRLVRAMRKRSRKGTCLDFNLRLAALSEKKHARSTSGKLWYLPERGGHSSSNRFDLHSNGSGKSPSNAQACTILPPFCWIQPSSIHG